MIGLDAIDVQALTLACELDARGLHLLVDGNVLVVRPGVLVTPTQDRLIREHKRELLCLARLLDDRVLARRDHFRVQWLARRPGEPVRPFVFTANTPYVKHRCYACGDAIDGWGTCWRCQLARRLALGVADDPGLVAQDEARVCA